jgi:hypothetical protein
VRRGVGRPRRRGRGGRRRRRGSRHGGRRCSRRGRRPRLAAPVLPRRLRTVGLARGLLHGWCALAPGRGLLRRLFRMAEAPARLRWGRRCLGALDLDGGEGARGTGWLRDGRRRRCGRRCGRGRPRRRARRRRTRLWRRSRLRRSPRRRRRSSTDEAGGCGRRHSHVGRRRRRRCVWAGRRPDRRSLDTDDRRAVGLGSRHGDERLRRLLEQGQRERDGADAGSGEHDCAQQPRGDPPHASPLPCRQSRYAYRQAEGKLKGG